jgi:threonine/homoserine/homoserine lactone efflux protein
MDATTFTAFVVAAIPGFFTPGPNNLMLMASSAKFGFRRTIPHGLGVAIGFALMVVLVGLGLGEVFARLPWLEMVLKVLAAINLLYLAWTLLGLKIKDQGAGERLEKFLKRTGGERYLGIVMAVLVVASVVLFFL